MEVFWIIFVQLITALIIIGVVYKVRPGELEKVKKENKRLKEKLKSNEDVSIELKKSELIFTDKISKIERQLNTLKGKESTYQKEISELKVKYAQSQKFLKNCHKALNRNGYPIPKNPQVTLESKNFDWCNACHRNIRNCMCSN